MKYVAILISSSLICILNSNHVLSQPNISEDRIILAVRTISYPVRQFCTAFENTLKRNLKNNIATIPILNEYKGKAYSRYDGLLNDSPTANSIHVDIECGPNSISSGELVNSASRRPFSEKVAFSDPFYTTGVKLLLRREIAQKLKDSPPNSLGQMLKDLNIGVFDGTTTLKEFKKRENSYQSVPIEPIVDSVDKRRGTNALERALSALDNPETQINGRKINALASDSAILQSFLKNGVDPSGKDGELIYIKGRKPYKQENFAIFPSQEFPSPDNSQYLPGFNEQEKYAIATKKRAGSENSLSKIVNDSLQDLKNTDSELSKAQNELKIYDEADVKVPPLNPSSPSPLPSVPPTRPNVSTDNNWWFLPIITAFVPIVVAILNPELVKTIADWIKGKQPAKSTKPNITGRVLNIKTGAWIAGAKVSLDVGGIPVIGFTDAEGVFEFPPQNSGDGIRIRVDAEGYEMYERRIDMSNHKGIIDIRLTPKP
jgi:ABC-type amino acid transport substrate-binding protein